MKGKRMRVKFAGTFLYYIFDQEYQAQEFAKSYFPEDFPYSFACWNGYYNALVVDLSDGSMYIGEKK